MAETITLPKNINELPLGDPAWQELLSAYRPLPLPFLVRSIILDKISKGTQFLREITGRERVKEDVLRVLLSGSHPYLVSEEGTGKTRLAKSLLQLLPPVLSIRGCSFKDDPKWAWEQLCPRCRQVRNPVEQWGVEVIFPRERFSRIQGNEYTNEAKLLGIKDIQALVQGKAPSDPAIFIGTGIFNANRGILFIDELPAIRTKVQVLLHPILEEKVAILEEYNWRREVDLLLVATGNPVGFVHVNDVPRPLLDRLEMIYMDLPDRAAEREIMEKESFPRSLFSGGESDTGQEEQWDFYLPEPLPRQALVPWWLGEVITRAVRLSRSCPKLEKKAGLRSTIKAFDHAISSAELRKSRAVQTEDVVKGLQLALRGRVGLRLEFQNYEDPREVYEKTDRLVEDLARISLEEVAAEIFQKHLGEEGLKESLSALCRMNQLEMNSQWGRFPVIAGIMNRLRKVQLEKDPIPGKTVLMKEENGDSWNRAAVELIGQMGILQKIIDPQSTDQHFFIPRLWDET